MNVLRGTKFFISGAHHTDHCGVDAYEKAKDLGKAIAQEKGVVLVGTQGGFPMWVALGAEEAGGAVIHFSPQHEHERLAADEESVNSVIYTGLGEVGTSMMLVRSCDIVLIGCGKMASLHEFRAAYEEDKAIGILKGPWRTDETINSLIKESDIERDRIAESENPSELVLKTIAFL